MSTLVINPFTTAHFVVFQFGPILYGCWSNINKSCEVNLQANTILLFVTDTWIVEHYVQGSYNLMF